MKKKLWILLLLFVLMPIVANAKTRYLYDTLRDELTTELTKETTYNHHDSFTEEPTHKIYYWYSKIGDDTRNNQIQEKRNVIFGNFCWQTFRTTDTGGVKMIYNGVPTNGQCNATGAAATIGSSKYNNTDTLAGLGYMYNRTKTHNFKTYYSERVLNSSSLSTTNYYSTDVEYNTKYRLVNQFLVNSSDDYPNLVNHYTYNTNASERSLTYVFYIVKVVGNTGYYITYENGQTASNTSISYTYGDNYTDNGNGTYTITNPTTIPVGDYYDHSSEFRNKYVCKNATNNTCNDVWYVTSASTTSFSYEKINELYKYANSFTYENGVYTLNDDSFNTWDIVNNNYNLRNHHYTCFNETGVCDTVNYIFTLRDGAISYYQLSNGASIEDVVNDILYAEDVNRINSTLKSTIDSWYANNLIDYTDYIEDTIYCNSRELETNSGFNPNNGNLNSWVGFNHSLLCNVETDKFSVNNPKAKLTYPVGAITYREVSLNNNYISGIGVYSWTMSPGYYYRNGAAAYTVGPTGSTTNLYSVGETGIYVRPVVSLKPKTRYASGDGSKNNPYIIDYNTYYSIDVEIKNETKELDIGLEDFTTVQEGEEVVFKVTPIKGYKVTGIRIVDSNNNEIDVQKTSNKNEYVFTMPASDVTIMPSYEKVSNSVTIEDNNNTKEIKIEVNDASAVVYEDRVVFTVEPDEGYEVDSIVIKDEEGNDINYQKLNENKYEFIMPDTNVIITPVYKKIEIITPEIVNPKTHSIFYAVIIISLALWLGLLISKIKRVN